MDSEIKYSIEWLTKEFATHAEMADKLWQCDKELPHLSKHTEPFNVARALSVMCAEIEKLKESLCPEIYQ